MREIEQKDRWWLIESAARLLVRRGVRETEEALLYCLPYVTDESTEEEIWYRLDVLTEYVGKVTAALTKALADRLPARPALWAGVETRRSALGCEAT